MKRPPRSIQPARYKASFKAITPEPLARISMPLHHGIRHDPIDAAKL
ncbi:MAG: hypothetical protein ABSH28_15315 [Acidobacteriota bacterium]